MYSPIPEEQFALAVATDDEPSIGTDGDVACVSGDLVAREFFLLHQTKLVSGLVDDDVVVQTLSSDVQAAGMPGEYGYGMHGGIRDVLDGNSNVPLPN